MGRRRWTDDQFTIAVAESFTITAVLRKLKLSTSPGNYALFHCQVLKLGLDVSHFTGQAHGTSVSPNKKTTEELFHSPSPSGLKQRLLKEGVLLDVCVICGQGPEWNGRPLTLHMDHIDGNPRNNRLDNLRIVCPHCHSQTPTFKGGNKPRGRYSIEGNLCVGCKAPISVKATRCRHCAGKQCNAPRIDWPRPGEVKRMVNETSYKAVAVGLGVSDSAIKKFLIRTLGEAPRKYRKFP